MSHRGHSGRARLAAIAAALLAAVLYAAAQAQEIPKATAEHAALGRAEGTWDASVEISMGPPGTPPQISKGVETNRLCCGGLWMITEFKSNPGSSPFEGHGITGYEPAKKKYTSTWVDSDLTTPMTSEGAYDAAGKTLTMRGSMMSRGKTMQWRDVEVWKDDDTRQFTMYRRGAARQGARRLSITYTRRKGRLPRPRPAPPAPSCAPARAPL